MFCDPLRAGKTVRAWRDVRRRERSCAPLVASKCHASAAGAHDRWSSGAGAHARHRRRGFRCSPVRVRIRAVRRGKRDRSRHWNGTRPATPCDLIAQHYPDSRLARLSRRMKLLRRKNNLVHPVIPICNERSQRKKYRPIVAAGDNRSALIVSPRLKLWMRADALDRVSAHRIGLGPSRWSISGAEQIAATLEFDDAPGVIGLTMGWTFDEASNAGGSWLKYRVLAWHLNHLILSVGIFRTERVRVRPAETPQ